MGTWKTRKTERLKLRIKDRPKLLILAEIALSFVILVYLMKIGALVASLHSNYGPQKTSLFLVIFETVMLYIAFDALLGVSSNRPKSWRKVVRSGFILIAVVAVATLMDTATLGSTLVTIRLPWVLIILVPAILLMFTPSVRDYYTPPLMEKKPLGAWIRFIGFTPLYDVKHFRLRYDEGRSMDL